MYARSASVGYVLCKKIGSLLSKYVCVDNRFGLGVSPGAHHGTCFSAQGAWQEAGAEAAPSLFAVAIDEAGGPVVQSLKTIFLVRRGVSWAGT